MRFILMLITALLLAACAGSWHAKEYFDQGDYGKASSGTIRLANQGDPEAEMDLGYLFEHGLGGMVKDLGKAQAYYQEAGGQGLARADTCLALLLIWSKEIPQDVPRGVELLKRADAAGDPYAAYDLYRLYAEGKEVPKDQAEADRFKARAGTAADDALRIYAMRMRSHVAANQHYPGTAYAGHYGGKVTVEFTIEVPYAKGATVVESSGHADLDDAAIAAVYQTYYPSMPPGLWQPEHFTVVINFQYPDQK